MGAINGHRKRISKVRYNVIIGNGSSSIPDIPSWQNKVIGTPTVSAFEIVGTDVFISINDPFTFVVNANISNPWTFFEDLDGLMTDVTTNAFRSMGSLVGDMTLSGVQVVTGANPFRFTQNANLGNLYMPNLLELRATSFLRQCTFKEFHAVNCQILDATFPFIFATSLNLVNMPNCSTIGTDPTVYESIFRDITLGCVLNLPSVHATSNNGGIDADVAYAINSRNCTVNFI